MTKAIDLPSRTVQSLQKLVDQGRFTSVSDVIEEGLRLIDEHDRHLLDIDRDLSIGIADADAGRLHDGQDVFAKLRAIIEDQRHGGSRRR